LRDGSRRYKSAVRIKQLRQVMKEKKMRDGEGFQTDETLLASQLLAFCEGRTIA
jgi:hypothetical protein